MDIQSNNAGETAMINELRQAIDQYAPSNISIGAGLSGAQAFSQTSHEQRVLLTWQWLEQFDKLAPNTIIIVPEHAINEKFKALASQKNITLIPIFGVLHTKTSDNLNQAHAHEFAPNTDYILMLPGDTQQEDGTWKPFNQAMLASLLADLPTERRIAILNGPRTGKYLENQLIEDAEAHRTKLDHITASVKDRQIPNWTIFDFNYGAPSHWDSALGFCLKHPNAGLILPGESTSMISEALSLGIRPIIYSHAAMTQTSHRYVELLGDYSYRYPDWTKADFKQSPIPNQIPVIMQQLENLLGLEPASPRKKLGR